MSEFDLPINLKLACFALMDEFRFWKVEWEGGDLSTYDDIDDPTWRNAGTSPREYIRGSKTRNAIENVADQLWDERILPFELERDGTYRRLPQYDSTLLEAYAEEDVSE